MKALVCIAPGNLEYREVEAPTMQAGFSLLKIRRVGVCGTDLHAYEGTQPFFEYPRILGHELSAEYVAGKANGFTPGDAVTVIPYFNCGSCIACRQGKPNCCTAIKVCGVHQDGAMTEYLLVPDYALVDGRGLSYEALALVEPLAIGAHAVERAGVEKRAYVLVMGAGPIGLGIMAFAQLRGAKVIALDVNSQRLSFCTEKLDVEAGINASKEEVTERLLQITNGDMPTVVVDATGNRNAINNGFAYMAHGGRYVLVGLQKEALTFSHPEFHKREGTLMSSRNATRSDFELVIHALSRKLVQPELFITHRVSFDKEKPDFAQWLHPASGVIKAMIEM